MTPITKLPRPTRSLVTNRRLNKAIKAANGTYRMENGLRVPARRTGLPRARRQDVAVAITGAVLLTTLVSVLSLVF